MDRSPQDRGTEIHTRLKYEIDDLRNPDFVAERSFLKTGDAAYGQRDSIRIDVFENTGDGAVCVYDIKSGVAGITGARMAEIASRAYARYPNTSRILVSEIRPQ